MQYMLKKNINFTIEVLCISEQEMKESTDQ